MYRLSSLFLVPALLAVGCMQEQAPPPEPATAAAPALEYHTPRAGAPFSEAVRVGDLLFLAGKLGTVPGQGLAPGGIEAETRQTMDNISDALTRYGSSIDRVVKCTVFLADIAEWGAMNDVYKTYFPERPPARSAMGVSGLALDARVEIECIAAVDA